MKAINIPKKCKECSKLYSFRYHRHCDTCQRLEFEENILCDLNRSLQDFNSFKCSTFEPRFKVINSAIKPEESIGPRLQERKSIPYKRLLNSDKIKYERALALQGLKHNPNAVIVQIKYHFAWNVVYRSRIFRDDNKLIETAISLFNESSLVVKDFVHLLFLAPDHVHLLVESNGELSVEELANRIKELTNNGLLKEYPALKELVDNNSIWDDAYFAETLG